jgi:crotonobetainyl-CoA:carnitine CoA-transferase CaiB-like acyl-CoA transferase
MTKSAGQALLQRMAAHSDVVIENFKVGGLQKYGLDYESLRAINPRLIYCSITGFGQTGPYANRAGYDFMIQGMAGVMSVTGAPDGEPMKAGVAFSDLFAGLHAVIGIQAALLHREKTGVGQHVDISLLDSQVSVLANQAQNYLVGGKVPQRLGNAHPNIVPYQTFKTADGHINMAVGSDRQYAEFCKIIGVPELAGKPYDTNRGRVENRASLIPRIAPALEKCTTQEWVQAFEAAAVPCGPINTIDQVFDNPQIKARGLVEYVERDDGLKVPTVKNPIVFSETPTHSQSAPPTLGQHTTQVLKHVVGLTNEEIAILMSADVIK